MLAPISWRVPPRHYGPWERFVSLLTEGLVGRGVDVTPFATGDSLPTARLASGVARGWAGDPEIDAKVAECLHIAAAFERAGEFDLLHNSFDFLPLSYCGLVSTPVLTTIHGFSSPRILPVYVKYNRRSAYVAISNADRHPSLDYLATIHHGIDTDAFHLHPAPGAYLLFFGRIHPDKGTAEAIEVAAGVGMPLVLAGIVQDQAYFDACVAPHIDGERVRFLGAVGADRRAEILGGALALLHLIGFDEPFGLSVVEAMACGTPVLAFGHGSVSEVVDPGITGAIVHSTEEAIRLLVQVMALDRNAVRRQFERRFSATRMAKDYLAIYHRLLGRPLSPPMAAALQQPIAADSNLN